MANLFEKAVLINVTINSLGTRRKVKSQEVEVDADKDMVHVSKDILQSEILDNIKKFDAETRRWISDRSLPSLFRSGVYLWPIALVIAADEYMETRIQKRSDLVESFISEYQKEKNKAAEKLGSLFNALDYPDANKVRSSFSMTYQFIEFGIPGRIKELSPEIFAKESEKAAEQWKSALEDAKEILRTELAGLVSHLHERMLPGDDGKPKRFKASLIENFQTFLELFNPRNIADDSELQAVVDQCKAAMSGVSAETIRSSDSLRESLASSMAGIKESVSGLITTAGRNIDISTDDSGDTWDDI